MVSLGDALDGKFDAFYEEQRRVRFERCESGYIVESEGPMWEGEGVVFGEENVRGNGKGDHDGLLWRHGARWDEWT